VNFYLDASAIVPMLAAQSMSTAAQAFMEHAAAPLWVSDLGESEVAAAASRLVRMRQLTAAQGAAMLADFDEWFAAEATPVAIESSDFRIAIQLVRRFELMLLTPDALHLAISMRLSAELITFDGRFAIAAEAMGLPVRIPS
jgi:predicted nucleic acid-binding protein